MLPRVNSCTVSKKYTPPGIASSRYGETRRSRGFKLGYHHTLVLNRQTAFRTNVGIRRTGEPRPGATTSFWSLVNLAPEAGWAKMNLYSTYTGPGMAAPS